jgi:hypothetical protein
VYYAYAYADTVLLQLFANTFHYFRRTLPVRVTRPAGPPHRTIGFKLTC